VDVTCKGLSADKGSVAYTIAVHSPKPIEEVHFRLKTLDDGGKTLADDMLVWQNIVKSARQPIEDGKSYDDASSVDPGAARAECALKEVVFKDGTMWRAP
jgi:hypothetical protein